MVSTHRKNKTELELVEFVTNKSEKYAKLFRELLLTSSECRWEVAFVTDSGVSFFQDTIKEAVSSGVKIWCMTSLKTHATQPSALKRLLDIGVHINLYIDKKNVLYHPKMFIFSENDIHHVLIGSANLTGRAFGSNIEGGVHIKGGEAVGEMVDSFAETWQGKNTRLFDYRFIELNEHIFSIWNNHPKFDDVESLYPKLVFDKPTNMDERVISVTQPGMIYHSNDVTKLVKESFPEWCYGRTPEASIRRTLNYNSTNHPPKNRPIAFDYISKAHFRRRPL